MWRQLAVSIPSDVQQALLLSAVSILVGLLVYLILRRRVLAAGARPGAAKGPARVLAAVVLAVVLLALAHIWSGVVFRSGTRQPSERARFIFENALWTCAAALVIYFLVSAARRALIGTSVEIEARHKIRSMTAWIGIGAFVVAAIFIWASGIKDLGIFLGIVGAGIALSLQETLLSVAGWMVLAVRRPYDIGDRIEIDGRIGDVIGISVLHTSLLEVGNWVKGDQSTGRMLILPNSMLVRHAVYNYSKGFPFVWNEFCTVVTFESDWVEAKRLMLEKAEVEADKVEPEVKRQIEQMQASYAIRYEQLTPIVYTSIADHGVELTLRFLSPVRNRRAMNHRISENVLHAFIRHPRIDFAYPTTRIYRNNEEGKPALGGPATDSFSQA